MVPGPIVGASDPEEVEGAPVGGAEAAEAAEPEEVGNGPAEPEEAPEGGARRPFGIAPRRGPPPKATTASRFVYTYSLVALVDKAEEEERERIYRERAEERAKGKGGKGDKGAEANGKAEGWGMRGTSIAVGGAQKHFNERKAREPRAKEPEREEKGSHGKPVVESPTHLGRIWPRRSF